MKLSVENANASSPSNAFIPAIAVRSEVFSFALNFVSPGNGASGLNTNVAESDQMNLPGIAGVNSTYGVADHCVVESPRATALENFSVSTEVFGTIPLGSGAETRNNSASFRKHDEKMIASEKDNTAMTFFI